VRKNRGGLLIMHLPFPLQRVSSAPWRDYKGVMRQRELQAQPVQRPLSTHGQIQAQVEVLLQKEEDSVLDKT
jgi:hypothetical protein